MTYWPKNRRGEMRKLLSPVAWVLLLFACLGLGVLLYNIKPQDYGHFIAITALVVAASCILGKAATDDFNDWTNNLAP